MGGPVRLTKREIREMVNKVGKAAEDAVKKAELAQREAKKAEKEAAAAEKKASAAQQQAQIFRKKFEGPKPHKYGGFKKLDETDFPKRLRTNPIRTAKKEDVAPERRVRIASAKTPPLKKSGTVGRLENFGDVTMLDLKSGMRFTVRAKVFNSKAKAETEQKKLEQSTGKKHRIFYIDKGRYGLTTAKEYKNKLQGKMRTGVHR